MESWGKYLNAEVILFAEFVISEIRINSIKFCLNFRHKNESHKNHLHIDACFPGWQASMISFRKTSNLLFGVECYS